MPSIGKDLVKIRKHLGLTLQDIQFATKLPQHTLEKIENDTIFADAEEGPIYTRNFIRSYGRVLKIDGELLIDTLDLREDEKYNHQLLRDFPDLLEEVQGVADKSSDEDTGKTTSDKSVEKTVTQSRLDSNKDDASKSFSNEPDNERNKREDIYDSKTDSASQAGSTEPASNIKMGKKDAENTFDSPKTVAAATPGSGSAKPKKKKIAHEKSVKEVNWADVGQKLNQEKKQLPAWVIGLVILIVVLAVAGYFVYQSGLLSSDNAAEQEITTPAGEATGSSLSIDLDEPESQQTDESQVEQQPIVTLDDTLTIVVHAAFGNVDPVRVWSDTKPRFDPYWIEESNAMTFDFENTVQVRGPYNNMLIYLNGHLIENIVQNFYNDEEDYVELNRSDFISDTKWSETTDLQVPEDVEPPQEIQKRPTFY